MDNNQDNINQLLNKLEILLKKQDDLSKEINNLKIEIDKLKNTEKKQTPEQIGIKKDKITTQQKNENKKSAVHYNKRNQNNKRNQINKEQISTFIKKNLNLNIDFEKFIGENLINKIGIAITIIGVAIGAKYSIEHDLISPLTRIILGYLTGIVMLIFGIRLKKKYKNYSAVLVSGAMAILYFITFSAYNFYDLIPQIIAFALMFVFTAFTVIASINYNSQVIAHIGLVGAYAVPFLLSDGSGKVAVLFSYIAIINFGILVISFKRYWKSLYYSSFGLTWLIYLLWFVNKYQTDEHFGLALFFLSIFFITFYITSLAYKLLKKEKFQIDDIILVLANSFIFFGNGYVILNNHKTGEYLLGAFTLCNAILHFIVSVIIYRQKLADRNLFYLITGLVLVFITISIPIQLDGNWVTLLWIGEAALLFWIGRTKNVPFYEKLSYPMMIFSFFSIVHDWTTRYDIYIEEIDSRLVPIFNINFLTSLLFISAFSFIYHLYCNKKYSSAFKDQKGWLELISFILPTILILTIYYAFRLEIANYWNQLYADSSIKISSEENQYLSYYRNYDLIKFKKIWIINYSLLFVSLLAFVNFRKLKNQQFGFINIILILLCLLVFLTQGLFILSELRESYLEQSLSEYYHRGILNLVIRYISYSFIILTLFAFYKYLQQEFMKKKFNVVFNIIIHISLLWIASSELIHWFDIYASTQSYKLGLSILWGFYSLFLIVLGIWKKKKYLRIGAFILFGITLIKLFFYDLSHFNTIAKTIVFVSLGVLLLIISFLYNKYKNIISDEKHI